MMRRGGGTGGSDRTSLVSAAGWGDDEDDTRSSAWAGPSGGSGGGGGRADGGGGRAGGGGGSDERGLKSITAAEEQRLQAMIAGTGDSDFCDCILYVRDGDPSSNLALDVLNGNVMLKTKTFIQDVDDLTARPTWLNGVPIIVDKATRKAHRGTAALGFLRSFKSHGAIGQMGRRMNKGKRAAFDSAMMFENNNTVSTAPFDMSEVPVPTRGRVPSAMRHGPGGKVSDRDIAALAAERDRVNASAKLWQKRR